MDLGCGNLIDFLGYDFPDRRHLMFPTVLVDQSPLPHYARIDLIVARSKIDARGV